MTKISNETEFKEVINKDELSLVAFGSLSCGKCMMAKTKYPSYEEALGDLAKLYYVNAEDCADLFKQYGVDHMPVFILFKKGQNIGTRSALGTPDGIVDFVKVNNK